MKDHSELAQDVAALRARLKELEQSEAERVRTEEALRQAQERFDLTIRGSSDGFWDGQPLPNEPWYSPRTPVWYSPQFKALLGYEEHELKNVLESFTSHLHPDDKDRVFAALSAHIGEKVPYNVEYRLLTKSGEYRWFSARGQAIWDEAGNLMRMAGNLCDINDRKVAEAGLEKRHQFEDLITSISTNFINLPSTEIDEGINDALQAICEFTSVDRSWVALCSEDQQMWTETHEWCADGILPTLNRVPPQIPADSIPWLSQQLSQKETVFMPRVADLPPEAKAEKELWQALEVQSSIIVPMICRNVLIGGVSFDSVRQEKTWEKDDVALLRMVGEIFANALERKQTEQALRDAKEGLELRVQERTNELQHALYQADNANRAKSRFLANMSHELRTPLNGILGYAQIMKRDRHLTPSQRSGVEVMQLSGEHLLTLINDILDLSKIEAEKLDLLPSPFHLMDLLRNVVDIIRIRAEQKSLSLLFEPASELPTVVHGDEKRLRQVLLNLLGNAVKFTDRGSVTFTSCIADDSPEPHVLRFGVEDTGRGIAPDKLTEIFKPFHQVHEPEKQAEGTGLGLSISQKLVHLMGGEIRVTSTVGKGSLFTVTISLPPTEEYEVVATKATPNISGFKGDPKHILIVDDKPANRAILINLLTPLGFRVSEAANGREGLVNAEADPPDLIVMDLVMPELDGFEATRRIRQHPDLKHVPVIASSASVFEQDRQESLDAGCTDFLPKPVKLEVLFEKLGYHLHLEWVCDQGNHAELQPSAADQPLIAPASEQVAALLELAKKGKILAIREHITNIEQLDEAYQPFVTETRRFIKGYELKKLCAFLRPYLERAE